MFHTGIRASEMEMRVLRGVRKGCRWLLRACAVLRQKLHGRRHADAHHAEHPSELAAHHGGGGEQKLLAALVRLADDAVAVVEVVEKLRQLKSMFGSVGGFSGSDALLDHQRGFGRRQPQLPDLVAASPSRCLVNSTS